MKPCQRKERLEMEREIERIGPARATESLDQAVPEAGTLLDFSVI